VGKWRRDEHLHAGRSLHAGRTVSRTLGTAPISSGAPPISSGAPPIRRLSSCDQSTDEPKAGAGMAARRPKRTPRRRALLRLSAWVNTTTDGACGEALSIEKYRRYKTRVPSDGLTSWLCWDLVVGSPSSSRVRRARPPERTAQV
jgi:hypothetical protein